MALETQVLEDGRISIPYTRSRDVYSFSDAIVLSPEVYETLTEEDITNMMSVRFENWYNHVTYVPPEAPEEDNTVA